MGNPPTSTSTLFNTIHFLYINSYKSFTITTTRMWANAQRDGHPTKYRWRPMFNAAKYGWHPLLDCHAVTLPRCETHWNLQACPKLLNRSQPLVGRSSPYYEDIRRRYCCLIHFYDCRYMPLVVKIQPNKVVRWRQDGDFWRLFAWCISSEPHAIHFTPTF